MLHLLLLCCSVMASAMEPATRCAIWQDSSSISSLIGIWHNRLFLVHSSADKHDITAINLETGCGEITINLPNRIMQWAIDKEEEHIAVLLDDETIAVINISQGKLISFFKPVQFPQARAGDRYAPPLNTPIYSISFFKKTPIVVMQCVFSHALNVCWANGKKIYGGYSSDSRNTLLSNNGHILEVYDNSFKISHIEVRGNKTYKTNDNCHFAFSRRSNYCAVWHKNTLDVIDLNSYAICVSYQIDNLSAIAWGNDTRIFVARNKDVLCFNVTEQNALPITFAIDAPDKIIDLVISKDERTFAAHTYNNECILWKLDLEKPMHGLFGRTITALKELFVKYGIQ